MAQHRPCQGPLPLVILPTGEVLHNPSIADLGRKLGLSGRPPARDVFDVAIVGAGPAGLSAAVYAASEGLSVTVLDAVGYGGQAGASMRIENYLGFPTGITGKALAGRAFVQAEKFGADIVYPARVNELVSLGPAGPYRLDLSDGSAVTARSVVIASGARYRRPAIPDIERFEGRGIWYWASPLEAKMCAGAEVALVGGGNSAGQAAVYLAAHAAKVSLLIRGDDLRRSMSQYLVDRIAATPNIVLCTGSEVVGLDGDAAGHLAGVRWRCRHDGRIESRSDPRSLHLRRRRSRDELGAAVRAEARRQRLRADRGGGSGRGTGQGRARGEPSRSLRHRRRPRLLGEARRRRDRRRGGRRRVDPRRPRAVEASRIFPIHDTVGVTGPDTASAAPPPLSISRPAADTENPPQALFSCAWRDFIISLNWIASNRAPGTIAAAATRQPVVKEAPRTRGRRHQDQPPRR